MSERPTDFGSVAIGTRITNIETAFFVSWTRMITEGLRPGDAVLHPASGLPHSVACNFLCKQFLQSNCGSLLFVDDDQEFEPGVLEALRETKGYDVVTGLICARRGFEPVALQEKDKKYEAVQNLKGVVDVDVSGFGFTLIKRWIIEELVTKAGTDAIFQWHSKYGEDGRFAGQAAELGAKIGVNCAVAIGHILPMTVYYNLEKQGPEVFLANDLGMKMKAQTTENEGGR